MQYLRNRDFRIVTSFLTMYPMHIISGSSYPEKKINWPCGKKISFKIDYWGDNEVIPRMTRKQAALAVVIYNDVEICLYKKSLKGDIGVKFETKKRSRAEWTEMVQNFLNNHPDFKSKIWYKFLDESWIDNEESIKCVVK